MTDREVMKMALDALNNFDKGNHGMRWQVPVIKALRTVLAPDVHCPVCGFYCLGKGGVYCIDKPTLTQQNSSSNISSSSAPEPEPVAWISTGPARMINWESDKPVYGDDWIPLYTAPPQRKEWVGLTDNEYELMAEKRVTNYFFNTLDYAHDIEAKLKEKNI